MRGGAGVRHRAHALAHLAQRTEAETSGIAGKAPRAPGEPGLRRQRAQMKSLGLRGAVARDLFRVAIERRDLVGAHARARKPGRDMHVAESLDVGEHLVAAGAGGRARGREGIADEHDAGPHTTGADIEIDRPDLHVDDLHIADELAQAGHHREHRLLPGVAHLP